MKTIFGCIALPQRREAKGHRQKSDRKVKKVTTCQLRPEGRNVRCGTWLRGCSSEARKGSQGPREALQGPRRGAFVFNRAGKEGGPLSLRGPVLVAQCSATPATVPATPPFSATPKFRCDTSWEWGGGGGGGGKGATPEFLGGTAATPAKRYKIQISCDTCSATGGTRNRVQLRVPFSRMPP